MDDRRPWVAAWRAVRADWSAIGRWVRVRRLVLPALLVWAMFDQGRAGLWTVLAATLVVVALLARFTAPAAALLLVAAVAGAAPAAAAVAVPVTAYAAARRITAPRRTGAVFALAAAVLAAGTAVSTALSLTYTAILAAALVGVGLVLPGAVGALVGERARRVAALRERNDILERAHRLGDEQARLQERARIAGEMHDLLGHRLSLISLHAGALEMGTRQGAPALTEQATLVRTTARTALDELRGVLGILKVDAPGPDTDGHGDDAGTRADVSALVLASQRAGVPVELRWDGDDLAGLDGRVRRAVHRVVRESLTNVHRHAPGATTTVAVERGTEWIRVEVRNALPARRAPAAPGTRMGLVGLQERVRLIGGTIRAGASLDGTVFVVAALLPLEPAPAAPPEPRAAGPGGPDGGATTIDQPELVDRQTSGAPPGTETAPRTGPPTPGSTDTMRKPILIVLTVLLGVVVICCGGALIGGKLYQNKAKAASITPEVYTAVRLGQPEDRVRETVNVKGSLAKSALFGEEPPVPAGSRCIYALSSKTVNDMTPLVYRFCFAGGTLVEKREIRSPDADPTGK